MFCFHSCKICFGARIRSRLRGRGGGGAAASASCLNPKLVYCSMIFSALLGRRLALCFHSCKIRFGTRIRSRLREGGGGAAA